MTLQSYKENMARREYESNLSAVKRISDVLSGTMKPKGTGNSAIVRAEQVELALPALTGAVRYEFKNGAGPAMDFSIGAFSRMKHMAQSLFSVDGTLATKLTNRLTALSCLLPGDKIDSPFRVDGSFEFSKAVDEVFAKLPFSVKSKISKVTFCEIDTGKVLGTMFSGGEPVIAIARGLSQKDLRETLAHEIAHIVLDHRGSSPENEAAADKLVKQWLYRK